MFRDWGNPVFFLFHQLGVGCRDPAVFAGKIFDLKPTGSVDIKIGETVAGVDFCELCTGRVAGGSDL